MTVTIKSLADGQLAASKGTIYTTPASTQAIIKRITLVNSDSSARAVNLYFKASGGTSRRLTPKDYSLAVGALLVMDDEVTLEAADIIEGDAAAATVVDFVISGVQNT
ncbi:hypothetical protein LCGC14_0830320 [marine sediment metagenome]|uniref:Uncharacterized protein n=1 Tax=marine sediment metagenome TaxID=412755 RepID=A0A0F9PL01_9ZZZZ